MAGAMGVDTRKTKNKGMRSNNNLTNVFGSNGGDRKITDLRDKTPSSLVKISSSVSEEPTYQTTR